MLMSLQQVNQRSLKSVIRKSNLSLLLLRNNASTLVIAEPNTSDPSSLTPSTLSTISAACKVSPNDNPITILNLVVSGTEIKNKLDISKLPPSVTSVIHANLNNLLPESVSLAVQSAHSAHGYTHILSPANKFGSSILPRASALLNSSPITDVIQILSDDTYLRPIYAGNAIAKVQSTDTVKCISIRTTAFDKATCSDGPSTTSVNTVEELNTPEQSLTSLVGSSSSQSNDRPDLSTASIVVSGGRGLKSSDNFKTVIEQLASKLKAGVGASRAAVDAGYAPNDFQVGQTGKVVAPDLYLAVGISGAIQHLSGMKDSKTIVAINNDPEAPIFQVADYGLNQDLFKAVPELIEKL